MSFGNAQKINKTEDFITAYLMFKCNPVHIQNPSCQYSRFEVSGDFFCFGWMCPVNHLVLIGFNIALKALSVMELNPIKMTLTISTAKKGGGCG